MTQMMMWHHKDIQQRWNQHSAASLNDLCTLLESSIIDDSDDDVAPQRHSAEMEPALDTSLNNAQQDLTGNPNPVVIDLTNLDSTQDQISPSVPSARTQATNAQDTVQTDGAQADVAQTDLASQRPTSEAPVASTSHQLISRPTSDTQAGNANYQLVSENPVLDTKPPPLCRRRRRRPRAAAAADLRRKFVSGQFDEENPFVLISSVLLVQPDEGVSVLVVDRIGDYLPQSTEKSRVLVIPVGARHKCQQDRKNENRETTTGPPPCAAAPPQPCAHERASHRAGRASRRGRCTFSRI
ncbi:hypothetical protein F511_38002 [Dorcoceras hygrometricum]|uniref:Uncharacterized protein n=1 Tax=Dorcoceras hygrometricum TaxID=472368 RepID=A0A2Z7B7E6_9LAMI|nr:hypothetical protein F511_38002 [Dorcoceras hygrometricum]